MGQSLDEPYYVVLEIVNTQCKGLRMLEDAGVEKYALIDIRGAPKGPTRHLIRMLPEEAAKLPEGLLDTHVDKFTGSPSAWFHTDGCDVCNTILECSSFLVSARHVQGYTIVYSFVAPNSDAYRRINSALETQGIKFKVLEVGKFQPRSKKLTLKQERVLWLALKMGFFEYPRRLTMRELSQRLGIALSSVSEIMRRGFRRILEAHFDRTPP